MCSCGSVLSLTTCVTSLLTASAVMVAVDSFEVFCSVVEVATEVLSGDTCKALGRSTKSDGVVGPESLEESEQGLLDPAVAWQDDVSDGGLAPYVHPNDDFGEGNC